MQIRACLDCRGTVSIVIIVCILYIYKIICISDTLDSELGLKIEGAHMGEGFGFYTLRMVQGARC